MTDRVDLIDRVLNRLFVVFAEAKEILDVLTFGTMAEGDSLLYALLG